MSKKSKKKGKTAQRFYARATMPLPIPTRFYWAYGSNLCEERMHQRCPNAVKVGPLLLTQSRLVFRGYADCVHSDDAEARTPGGLWRITAEDEAALDRVEGVRGGFYRKVYITLGVDGEAHRCLVYQMYGEDGVMPPSQQYIQTLARGYQDFGLDLDYLENALREAWNDKRITSFMRQRRAQWNYQLARTLNRFKQNRLTAGKEPASKP